MDDFDPPSATGYTKHVRTPYRDPVVALCFLQNQWGRNPTTSDPIFERFKKAEDGHKMRSEYVRRCLMRSCRTGKILKRAWGVDLMVRVEWDNASPRISETPDGRFNSDARHMQEIVDAHKPGIIVVLGSVAQKGILAVKHNATVLAGPHPCARAIATMEPLKEIGKKLRDGGVMNMPKFDGGTQWP